MKYINNGHFIQTEDDNGNVKDYIIKFKDVCLIYIYNGEIKFKYDRRDNCHIRYPKLRLYGDDYGFEKIYNIKRMYKTNFDHVKCKYDNDVRIILKSQYGKKDVNYISFRRWMKRRFVVHGVYVQRRDMTIKCMCMDEDKNTFLYVTKIILEIGTGRDTEEEITTIFNYFERN